MRDNRIKIRLPEQYRNTDKVVNKVVSEMKAEQAAKANKAIEATAIYQGEMLKK